MTTPTTPSQASPGVGAQVMPPGSSRSCAWVQPPPPAESTTVKATVVDRYTPW